MLIKSKKLLYQNLDRSKGKPGMSAAQAEYLISCKRERRFVRSWQWIIMILFLGVWELGARLGLINAFVFSSPSGVAATIYSMAEDGSLWYHAGITLAETFLSFFAVTLLSVIAAIGLFTWSKAAKILEPALVVLNSL